MIFCYATFRLAQAPYPRTKFPTPRTLTTTWIHLRRRATTSMNTIIYLRHITINHLKHTTLTRRLLTYCMCGCWRLDGYWNCPLPLFFLLVGSNRRVERRFGLDGFVNQLINWLVCGLEWADEICQKPVESAPSEKPDQKSIFVGKAALCMGEWVVLLVSLSIEVSYRFEVCPCHHLSASRTSTVEPLCMLL